MGTERLIAAIAAALALALVACARGSGEPPQAADDAHAVRVAMRRHAQIVRAAPMPERLAVFERFRSKNDGPWKLLRPEEDIDAFRPFLRRAARTDLPGPEVPFEAGDAESTAVAFVNTNAAELGLHPAEVVVLDVTSRRLGPGDGPTPRTRFAVRLRGLIAMRGLEAFDSVASHVELTVFVDDDRRIRLFTNDSRLPPRLTIDTRPDLEPDDPRVLRNVLGRELFVAEDDPRRPGAGVRELRRIPVGTVTEKDVAARTLTIHASRGPLGAYVSFILAYVIRVSRGGEWFRFVVDADTGDLLEDAAVPVVRVRGAGATGVGEGP